MDARKVAVALRKIETSSGCLTPEAVVSAAKAARHPLHDQFEWDDSVAGQRYRLQQARQLISCVKVNFEVDNRTIRTVSYVRDPAVGPEAQGYRSVVKLAKEVDQARDAVVAEFARAAAHLRRARDIAAVLGQAEAVEELIARVVEVDQRIQTMGAQAQ